MTDPDRSDVAYTHELTTRLRNLYMIARDHKRQRYDSWIRNYRLVNNRVSSQGASWMPAPKDSEIYPILSSLVAWMTDQNMDLEFVPSMDPNTPLFDFYSTIGNDLGDVLYTAWVNYSFRAQNKLALWDAFMYGVGIFKSVWDNSLCEGKGDVNLRRVDPWAFYPDPNATSLADCEYMCEVRRMSLSEIERRWPGSATYLRAKGSPGGETVDERPNLFTAGTHTPRANPGALPGGTGVYGGAKSTYDEYDPLPGYVVYEFWLKENDEYYDDGEEDASEGSDGTKYVDAKWRVVIMCNGEILMDEDAEEVAPYGSHPYDRFVFDDIGEFYGISLVDHLASPAIHINRLLTAMQHNAELTGNPILVESAGSGTDRVGIVNKPGQRLTVRGPGGMVNQKPEWLDPPSMSAEVMQLVNFWISRLENTSGLSAMQKGATPNQRNAAEVVNNVQEAAFVRVRAAIQNLEDSLQSAGKKLADLIIDYYTEQRTVAIIGPDGQTSAKFLAARHFQIPGKNGAEPLSYSLRILAGSTTPTSRQTRMSEAVQLQALGVVDDEYVLQVAQVPRYKDILKRLYEKRANGLMGVPGKRQTTRS